MNKQTDEEKRMEDLINLYQDKYSKAYFKLAKFENNDLFFADILYTNMSVQDKYTGRDVRNIFFVNTYEKNKAIAFDKSLPREVNLWEYYYNFENLPENYFVDNDIFSNIEQIKGFSKSFLTRFFQSVDEYTFFDKMVINTLIKAKILVRHDSAEESIENTFQAFNFF
jgi:hypothetical protein